MKTYYGQMTKEQLNKTYFVPETIEEMNAFIDMCEKAECNAMSHKLNEVFPIGIGFSRDFNIQFSSDIAVYGNDRYMVRINWLPESERPASSWHECYCDNNIGGLYIGVLGAKRYILDAFGGNAISEGFHSFFLKGGELFGSIGAKQKPVALMKEAKKECGIKSQLAEAIAKRDKCKAKADKKLDKAKKAVESLNQAEKEVRRLIAELENEVESIGGISCKIAEMAKHEIPDGVDVDDPKTWRAGDVVECISVPNTKHFTEGKEYIFKGCDNFWFNLESDDEGDRNGWQLKSLAKFRFVRRP